jgi:hypothetical protein
VDAVTEVDVLQAMLREMQKLNATLALMVPPQVPEQPDQCCADPMIEPTGFGTNTWICRHCGAQGTA